MIWNLQGRWRLGATMALGVLCAHCTTAPLAVEVAPQVNTPCALGPALKARALEADITPAEMFARVVRDHDARGVAPGSPDADAAARAAFCRAELEYGAWDAIQFQGPIEAQQRALAAKLEGAKTLRRLYEKTYAYQSIEWTMAAGFRTANVLERFAQALLSADVPFEASSEEYDVYTKQLDDIARPLEDDAFEKYAKMLAKARELGVTNAWTLKARERLDVGRAASAHKAAPHDGASYDEEP